MRVLVDTDVIMDYIADREPYAEHAYRIIELCIIKKITGCIAAHTVTNLFFILRKELSIQERKATLIKLCKVFTVVGIEITKITAALENDKFSDIEDCLQDECARDFHADYIITRNVKDFVGGNVMAIEPIEFLTRFGYQ